MTPRLTRSEALIFQVLDVHGGVDEDVGSQPPIHRTQSTVERLSVVFSRAANEFGLVQASLLAIAPGGHQRYHMVVESP